MQNINNLHPFLFSGGKNKYEINKKIQHKSMSLSQDKIYYFRTSLFTEKSKNIILKMNLSHKKSTKANETSRIVVSKLNKEFKSPIRKISEKIYISDNKIKINNNDEKNQGNANIDINNKENNDNNNKENQPIKNNNKVKVANNSPNNKNNITINKNKDIIQIKSNKSKTQDKKDINTNNRTKQNINNKIINDIKKCKLFESLPVGMNNQNKSVIGNDIARNQSVANAYLANAASKQKDISQKKQFKICEYNNKIKYRLKSKKNNIKKIENKNMISFKSLNENTTLKKELKYLKSITKHSKIQSFSIFDDNYYISRYKLGNYYAKRNNRYNNKNAISEDKINIKQYIPNRLHGNNGNNIVSLIDNNNLILSRKEKIV